jgi:hypothetical protein
MTDLWRLLWCFSGILLFPFRWDHAAYGWSESPVKCEFWGLGGREIRKHCRGEFEVNFHWLYKDQILVQPLITCLTHYTHFVLKISHFYLYIWIILIKCSPLFSSQTSLRSEWALHLISCTLHIHSFLDPGSFSTVLYIFFFWRLSYGFAQFLIFPISVFGQINLMLLSYHCIMFF